MDTPKPIYHIRHAIKDDVDAVLDLRQQAERWLATAGIEQWTNSETGRVNIQTQIDAGVTYVVTTAVGRIVACLTLDAADSDFWTPVEASQPALYLYKFIICGDRRGTGLGDALLDWACERSRLAGARWLRLDCWKTNTLLHKYYEERGFSHYETRDAPGRKSGALFERDTDLLLVKNPKVTLIDDSQPRLSGALEPFDRWDPTGEAKIWHAASQAVTELREEGSPPPGALADPWAEALRAAATRLAIHSKQIRQANGMYYRVISGKGGCD